MNELYVKSLEINNLSKSGNDSYISNLPIIKNLRCIDFKKPMTFFVGENGVGKSTLIEAIALKLGFNPEGGSKNFIFSTNPTHSDLHKYLKIIRGSKHPKDGYFLRSECFYNLATNMDDMDKIDCPLPPINNAYGGRSLHKQSHGESFLSLFFNRFLGNGLYILDEPEASLSPQSQMSLLVKFNDLVNLNSQFIVATHSPILLSYPLADVYEFTQSSVNLTTYSKTQHYIITKQFLNCPEKMFDILFNV